MSRFLAHAMAASLAVTGLATPALAQPRLLGAQPAEGAAAGHVTQVSLTFSEPLVAALSGMDVVMTGMPGMASHQPMKMTGVRSAVAPDGVTLVATLARPLPAGTYEADWHAVSADTHRVTGKLAFTVR